MLKPLHFKGEIEVGKVNIKVEITYIRVRNADLEYEPQRRGGAGIWFDEPQWRGGAGISLVL